MNYTSIEQSKKLLELGLSLESADMYWRESYSENLGLRYYPTVIWRGYQYNEERGDLPCWSIGALLDVIRDYGCVWLGANDICNWICEFNLGKGKHHVIEGQKYAIEAVYNMIVWLLENNYIKKEE